MEHQQKTINCRGRILDLSQPAVMGILNLTPDSFFDGGRYSSESGLLRKVEQMITDGMDILDVGGMSSRPGADIITVEEEIRRVIPSLRAIRNAFPDLLISLDTIRAEVARQALDLGIHLINDISAGRFDDQLLPIVAEYKVPYVLMHMKGDPALMQQDPQYGDVLTEVFDFLAKKLAACRALGIRDVILDPGFGFGKSVSHNYRLLSRLRVFHTLEAPLLVGISRKSMICKVLKVSPENALNGTTALHMVALQQGASVLRVHDVREARQTIRLWQELQSETSKIPITGAG